MHLHLITITNTAYFPTSGNILTVIKKKQLMEGKIKEGVELLKIIKVNLH